MHSAGLFIAFSALAATALAGAPGQQQQETPCPTMPHMPDGKCKLIANQDRPGFDFKSVKGSLNSCTDTCKATDGCVTWAWNNYEGGTCWLKAAASKPVDKEGVWTIKCELDEPSLVCQPLHNVDFQGNDIASVPASEAGKCCRICNAYPGCKAYAWSDFNSGTCWLKAGVTTAIWKEGVVSSSVVPLTEQVCPFEYDVDFVGNDIGNKLAKNPGECCSLCKGNKDCKAYSWNNYQGGTCWMKSGKGQTMKKAGVVSAKLI